MPATTAAAGFIAGAKWAALRKPSGEQKAAVGEVERRVFDVRCKYEFGPFFGTIATNVVQAYS
jgi:hypothetical protein